MSHVSALIQRSRGNLAAAYADLDRRGDLHTAAIAVFHDATIIGTRKRIADQYRSMFPRFAAELDVPPPSGMVYVTVPFGGSEGGPSGTAGMALFEFHPKQAAPLVRAFGLRSRS